MSVRFTGASLVFGAIFVCSVSNAGSGQGTALVRLQSASPGLTQIGYVNIEASQTVLRVHSVTGRAVYGTSANDVGLWGETTSANFAVIGNNGGPGGGVRGIAQSGFGVRGESSTGSAVFGTSTSGRGVWGSSGSSVGVWGETSSSNYAVIGNNTGTGGGVRGLSSSAAGVRGESTLSTGVFGSSTSGRGVWGTSANDVGVWGETGSSSSAIVGYNTGSGGAVLGMAQSGNAIRGETVSGSGVFGSSTSGRGVWGTSASDIGVWAETGGSNFALYAQSTGSGGAIRASANSGIGVIATTGSGAYAVTGTRGQTFGALASSTDGVYGTTSTTSGSGVGGRHLGRQTAGYLGTPLAGVTASVQTSVRSLFHGGLDSVATPSVEIDLTIQNSGEVRVQNVSSSPIGFMSQVAGQPSSGAIGVSSGSATALAGVYASGADGVVFGTIKTFRMQDPRDEEMDIVYACVEGPEVAAYARGTARLQSGRCNVELPDHFLLVANLETMTVQLTPRSASSRGLALTATTATGIEIRELANGTGSYEFDYQVTAVRKGYEKFPVSQPRLRFVPNSGLATSGAKS